MLPFGYVIFGYKMDEMSSVQGQVQNDSVLHM